MNGTDELGDDAATFEAVMFSPNCGFQIAVNVTQALRGQGGKIPESSSSSLHCEQLCFFP